MDVNRSNESYVVSVYIVTDTVSQGDTFTLEPRSVQKNTENGDKRYFIKMETPTVYKHYEMMLENVTNEQTNILMYL